MQPIEILYNEGLNDDEISERLGITVSVVVSWRRKNHRRAQRKVKLIKINIPPDTEKKKYYRTREDIYANLYKMGYNDEAIAYLCDVSARTVKTWRRKAELPIIHKITLAIAKNQIKRYMIEKAESEEPLDDPESLFGSPILEAICGKNLD